MDFIRVIKECALLASKDDQEIADILEIPLEEVYAASEAFPIRDKSLLERMEYVLKLTDKEERLYKLWSLTQGLEFIKWRLGKSPKINPVEGLETLFTDCVLKSKEAFFSGNAEEASIESTKWVKLSMDIARLLKAWTVDSEAAMKDLSIALQGATLSDLKSLSDITQHNDESGNP